MKTTTGIVRKVCAMALASLVAHILWAAGGVISINFNAGQGNGTADSGMVHVPAEAWMNVTGTANTRAGNSMNYYNGSEVVAGPSTMSIIWDGSSNYQYTDGITDNVLKGYLDDGKNTAITITGLPFKKYNVYVICATDTENAKFRHWTVNGVDYIGSAEGATAGTGNWGASRTATCALGTNVLKVSDQTGALTIVGAGKSGSNRGTLAAIQVEEVEVVAAPEANFVFDGASKSITRPEAEENWWNGWGGEGLNADTSALSPNGFVGAVADGRHPWTSSTVPSEFTLSLYTDPSLVSGDTKKLFWAVGDGLTSNIITLARDGDNLVFSAVGGSVSTPVPGAGYHLVTVTFSTSAISIAIDGQTPVKVEGTYDAVTTGFQIGSAYRGLPSGFAKPIGLPIAKLMGFSKVLTDAEIAALAVDYPAETIITGVRTFTGANLYIGSMNHMSGRLEVNRGTLTIPAGHTYSVPALRYGNAQGGTNAFGLELDGTLIISGGQTTDGNGQQGVRADVTNNRGGILFGEWEGYGTYNIRGTLDARNSFVQLVHDAHAQEFNVANGGVFKVKAFEARSSQSKERSTHVINIANGGQVISTQGFTRGKLMANVETGGVLEIASTATVNMEGNDLSGITGEGQLKLTGSGYCVIPKGEGKCPIETIEIVNNLANGIVVPAVAEVTIGSLSGTGTLRYDWGSNSRNLVIKQSKNTTWSGGIFSSNGHTSDVTRALNIVVKSENDSVLTVSGTVNGPASSTLTAGEGGTIKITGSCTGTGVVLDGGKLQSTGAGNAHGTMVKNLKLLQDGTYEWVEGGSTQIGIGANGVESTLDLNGHKITFTGKGTEQYDRVYLDKTTIPNAGTIEVTKGRLFIHCTVPTFPEDTKLVIGQNATIEVAGEIGDKTMTVTELEYNGTVAAPANEAPDMIVTSKFSGTGSIQKLTFADGVEVSGSATISVSAVAQGTVKLADDATLTVPAAFADEVVKTDVEGKHVAYNEVTKTYSLEGNPISIAIPTVEHMDVAVTTGGEAVTITDNAITLVPGTAFTVTYTPQAGYCGSAVSTDYTAGAETTVTAPEIPAAAVAQVAGVNYATVDEALANIGSNQFVMLLADVTTSTITIPENFFGAINLNGHTITRTAMGSYVIKVPASSYLELGGNGGIVNTAEQYPYAIENKGTVVLRGMNVQGMVTTMNGAWTFVEKTFNPTAPVTFYMDWNSIASVPYLAVEESVGSDKVTVSYREFNGAGETVYHAIPVTAEEQTFQGLQDVYTVHSISQYAKAALVTKSATKATIGILSGTYELNNATTADQGATVTFTVTPDEGCVLETVTVNGEAVTPDVEGVYSITVGEVVAIAAVANAPSTVDFHDPETITAGTTAAELGLANTAFTDDSGTTLKKVAEWAKAWDTNLDALNAIAATVAGDAYLLNVAPDADEVRDAKDAFAFDATDLAALLADPKAKPTVGTGDYNGTVKILGAETVNGEYRENNENAKFFKATLTK